MNKMVRGSLMRHINSAEGDVSVERFHCKAVSIEDILLTNLYHGPAICKHSPGLIQKVTSQGVEYHIYASSVGSSKDLFAEVRVSGVEDAVV